MPRSVRLAHVIRQADGSSVGVWGMYSLRTAFQPIFAFRHGRLQAVAFEGLLRPLRDGAEVPPLDFFAAVPDEERGNVDSLARTLHLLNAGATLDPEALVFVNFGLGGHDEPDAADAALREMRLALHEAGVAPARIVCEITEKASHSEALTSLVLALRRRGYLVAVDDYGAENSDMERIRSLNPDIVKFDAGWVRELMRSEAGFGLLREMVNQFSGMGIRTVFEGIEEGRQLELAERAGASMVQGYAVARPQLVPADFSAFMGKSPAGQGQEAAVAHPVPKEAARPSAGPPAKRVFGRRGS